MLARRCRSGTDLPRRDGEPALSPPRKFPQPAGGAGAGHEGCAGGGRQRQRNRRRLDVAGQAAIVRRKQPIAELAVRVAQRRARGAERERVGLLVDRERQRRANRPPPAGMSPAIAVSVTYWDAVAFPDLRSADDRVNLVEDDRFA